MKLAHIFLMLMIISWTVSLYAQQKTRPIESQFDEIYGEWTDETKPGISVAVLNDGKIDFQKSWGLSNLEYQIPISNESVFLFPLMSEQLLAFSILLLEERGQLTLNEKIRSSLDFLPKKMKNISVGQLLHHNSSLSDLNYVKIMSGWDRGKDVTKSDFLILLNSELAVRENKDQAHQYNQAGLRLLQMLLEKKTGMSFSEFAQKEIFNPLGMVNSQIASRKKNIKNKASGYIAAGNEFLVDNSGNDYLSCDQLYTTTAEMCLWVDNFWRPKIGSQVLWNQMDQYVTDKGKPLAEKNRSLFVGHHSYWNYRGTSKYYQIGMLGGYAAKMIRYPKYDLAIVVLGNFQKYNGHLATGTSDLYIEQFYEEEEKKELPVSVKLSKRELERHCGTYWDYKGESMATVTLKDDTLRYFDERYNWNPDLIPEGKDQFYIDARNLLHVNFNTNTDTKEMVLSPASPEDVVFSYIQKEPQDVNLSLYTGIFFNTNLGTLYEVVKHDDGLELKNKKGMSVIFKHLKDDTFKSTNRYFSRLQFKKNKNGEIESLEVSNGHIKDLAFVKL